MHPLTRYDVYRHPKYRFLCNMMHVETGTKAIAIVGLVCIGFSSIYDSPDLLDVINDASRSEIYRQKTIITYVMHTINIVALSLLLVAQFGRIYFLHLPFIALMMVHITFAAINIAFSLIILLTDVAKDKLAEYLRELLKNGKEPSVESFLWMHIVMSMLNLIFEPYLISVVWRAYKFMKWQDSVKWRTGISTSGVSAPGISGSERTALTASKD